MEEKSDEYLKYHSKIKIIGTNHTILLKETLVILTSKQVMKKYPDRDYQVL
jgi:hypothetical protein